MAMLQDILFLPWNTKISSLDECFKKEAVTANKSARGVFSLVNIWYFQISPLGRAKEKKEKKKNPGESKQEAKRYMTRKWSSPDGLEIRGKGKQKREAVENRTVSP